MQKNFITVTPDSGKGDSEIVVSTIPNPSFKVNTTKVNISASALKKEVDVKQYGNIMIGGVEYSYNNIYLQEGVVKIVDGVVYGSVFGPAVSRTSIIRIGVMSDKETINQLADKIKLEGKNGETVNSSIVNLETECNKKGMYGIMCDKIIFRDFINMVDEQVNIYFDNNDKGKTLIACCALGFSFGA